MVKVGLLGLGKTGKVVAQELFNDRKFDLVFAVKNKPARVKDFDYVVEPKEMLPTLVRRFKPDIIVDFTSPEATMHNVKHIPRNTGIVIATTGFTARQMKRLKSIRNRKVLYAPNISDGINLLMKACKCISSYWDGDVEIIEEHFKGKKDAPSGTAKKIGDLLGRNVPIHSVRAGGIVGVHKVIFANQNQKITIEHESFGREVFAAGAKRAILWLKEQRNGFYEVSNMYDTINGKRR